MIRYKVDISVELKKKGLLWVDFRKAGLGESTLTRMRRGLPPDSSTLNVLCRLLRKQSGQLLEYVPDDAE